MGPGGTALRYSTSVPNIASEIFDGEVVVANYLTGAYYSLAGSAAAIWQGLQNGMSLPEITTWMTGHFPDAADAIPDAVGDFVGRLLGEGMLAETTESAVSAPPPQLTLAAFEPPQLERFDDLADLLLLDPVHDVAEAGWPHLPETGKA